MGCIPSKEQVADSDGAAKPKLKIIPRPKKNPSPEELPSPDRTSAPWAQPGARWALKDGDIVEASKEPEP